MPEQQTRVLAGRYELITPLGRGTMGTVWRAHDRSLGREVAIKEIRQEPGLSEAQRAELRERMIREGRTAARISHPSVATVHDAIIEDGSPWIIMELVQARSLEQVVEEEGPLPPRLVAAIGVDLLDALRAAHAQGVLHRDVKPGNVLITESGRVVLTDFGIAKAEGDTSLTQTGMVIGSPGYTAPERARGEHTGPESDLWSLGATLYFAVEGRPAYERSTMAETLAALMTENVDPPVQAGPLRPVLEQLLEKDHTVRLTPSQAIAMLRAVADTPLAPSAPPEASRPPAAPAPTAGGAGSPSRHPAGPGSEGRAGAWAGDGTGSGAGSGPGTGTGPDEEFDANRTMMVARPTIGLPLPGTGRSPVTPPAFRPEAASGAVSDLGTPVARGARRSGPPGRARWPG
ncbi:serine/threonine-protein kinase, partial [Planomonospora algeriensis]